MFVPGGGGCWCGGRPPPLPRLGSPLQTVPPLSSRSFWFFKFLVLVGITVGAFYIPDGAFTSGEEMPPLPSASLGEPSAQD